MVRHSIHFPRLYVNVSFRFQAAPIYNPCNVLLQQLLATMPITPTRNRHQLGPSATTLPSSGFHTLELQTDSMPIDSILPTLSPPSSPFMLELQNDTLLSSSQCMTDEPSNPSPTMSRFL